MSLSICSKGHFLSLWAYGTLKQPLSVCLKGHFLDSWASICSKGNFLGSWVYFYIVNLFQLFILFIRYGRWDKSTHLLIYWYFIFTHLFFSLSLTQKWPFEWTLKDTFSLSFSHGVARSVSILTRPKVYLMRLFKKCSKCSMCSQCSKC